jgi:hypothetical protein
MKRYFFFLTVAFSSFILHAQSKYQKEPFLTKPLTNETIKMVEAQTSGGSISITGVSSDARIEVYIAPNNRKDDLNKDEIQKRLDEKYDLNVSVVNNKLVATAKPKEKMRDWKNALSISFKVFVPQNVSSNLTTSGGSISLSNVSGSHDFTTSGGSLNVNGVSGKINGRTSGGSINLENSRDEIELTTSGGSITAKNSEGKLRLATSGGSVVLNDLKGDIKAATSGGGVSGKNIAGELSAFTSGGSIQFSDLACSLKTGTSGGSIAVSFATLGKYVKISNSAGNINVELPKGKGLDLNLSAMKIKTDHLENFNGKIDDEQIDGKLNGGGIPVSVKAGSGRIYLALK